MTRPLIGVAIGGPTMDRALLAYDALAGRAGIVELRLDLFTEAVDLRRLIELRPCPVVITCRAAVEGGRFTGTEVERLGILRHAAELGAEYVDVERFALPGLGAVRPSQTIVSQHDFESMPADMAQRWSDIRDLGADVVKLAGMAAESTDILPVLDLLARADRPTIAMAMGPAGLASRVLALRYPMSVLTYASLDQESETAPGQLSLDEMHSIYRAGEIDASTAIYGIVAPELDLPLVAQYNRLLHERSKNAVCVPLIVTSPTEESLMRRLIDHGFKGFHIHGPRQEALVETVDSCSESARRAAAVNAITIEDERLVGNRVSSLAEQVDCWLNSPL